MRLLPPLPPCPCESEHYIQGSRALASIMSRSCQCSCHQPPPLTRAFTLYTMSKDAGERWLRVAS